VDGDLTYAASSSLATGSNQNVTLTNFISGVSTYSAAHYSEVGLINLIVEDIDYGNEGITIPSAAIDIGRFTPDHFTQTVAQHGSLMATCNTGTTFAYSGQKDEATGSIGAISYLTNPVLEITARNKQGEITKNYYQDNQGSVNDYMKLNNTGVTVTKPTLDKKEKGVDGNLLPLTANLSTGVLTTGDLSQNDLTILTNAGNPLDKGVLHYQLLDDHFFYNRSANALVTPFTSEIDFSINTIIDEDLIDLVPTNPLISPTTNDAEPDGVEIRFGRLVLENSYGPETSNLPQPMQVEYLDDTGFVLSLDDNCSTYDASKLILTNTNATNSLNPADTSKKGGTGNFVIGKTREVELEAPGAGKQGEIGVSYDSYDWLKFDWDSDGLHDDDPSAIATFGLFRGNDRIIYTREVLN
jgi:MSHA biogenesis protein MshQ